MRRASLLAASVIALTMALPVAQANAAPALTSSPGEVSTFACGYYPAPAPVAPDAMYNHCTSDGSYVWLIVQYRGGSDKYKCVGPGVTRLGSTSVIYNAYWDGRLCKKGD